MTHGLSRVGGALGEGLTSSMSLMAPFSPRATPGGDPRAGLRVPADWTGPYLR